MEKSKKAVREYIQATRLTFDQVDMLNHLAKQSGKTRSTYLKDLILEDYRRG